MDNIRHVPSLQGLQALVEVSDCASFTVAAQKLCLKRHMQADAKRTFTRREPILQPLQLRQDAPGTGQHLLTFGGPSRRVTAMPTSFTCPSPTTILRG